MREIFLNISENITGGLTSATESVSASAPAKLNNGGNFYFTIIVYLFAFLLIIAGILYFRKHFTKYFLNKLGRSKSGSYMKIIDSIALGADKQIILIETKNKILAVGITQQRMETLSEFSKEDFGTIDGGDVNDVSDENGKTGNESGFLK